MFVLKQFLKALLLPPGLWIVLLIVVLAFWKRSWARKLLTITTLLAFAFHWGLAARGLSYYLESRHPPLRDCRAAGPYDAIVVLTGGSIPATGLIPFPSIRETTFRRLEEAWRLYKCGPKPVIVSGGHANPFTPSQNENKIACDYLTLWGVPAGHVIAEATSRDTFESAVEVKKILERHRWKRYLLVTSAQHMPRSMLVFRTIAPEPQAAPGDFTVGKPQWSPLSFLPTESAAERIYAAAHEYLGLINYYWRARSYGP